MVPSMSKSIPSKGTISVGAVNAGEFLGEGIMVGMSLLSSHLFGGSWLGPLALSGSGWLLDPVKPVNKTATRPDE